MFDEDESEEDAMRRHNGLEPIIDEDESEEEATMRHKEETKMLIKELLADIREKETEIACLKEDMRNATVDAVKNYIDQLLTEKLKVLHELLDSTIVHIVTVPTEIHNALDSFKQEFDQLFAYVSTEPWPPTRDCKACSALINTSSEFAKAICNYCNLTKPVKAIAQQIMPKVITNLYPLVFSDTSYNAVPVSEKQDATPDQGKATNTYPRGGEPVEDLWCDIKVPANLVECECPGDSQDCRCAEPTEVSDD
jgi:hypothetical protein